MERYMLQFYAADAKLDATIFEEMKIQKYLNLYETVRKNFFSKLNKMFDPSSINQSYQFNNYDVYYKIIFLINQKIDDIYNDVLSNNCIDTEKRTMLMNVIKFETNRLSKMKKNFNVLGDNPIDAETINNIFTVYKVEDEKEFRILFTIIHNELKKKLSEKNIFDDEKLFKEEIENMLDKYEINENVRNKILSEYNLNKKCKVINLNEYKARKKIF